MDELTARLVAQERESKEHPEDWTVTLKCGACGREKTVATNKAEIEKYRAQRKLAAGTRVTITTRDCAACETEDDGDDD